MFFFHGKNLSDEMLYLDLISKMGLSPEVFLDDFHSERAADAVTESFRRAAMITKDFPMLYFRTENTLELLGNRFTEYDKINANCANMIMKTE
jgi:predicted DsbA family dithiol-disulfide isomerase